MIRGDIPLPVMMVVYRILALLVIDHELFDPALLRLYLVKPLIKAVHTQV